MLQSNSNVNKKDLVKNLAKVVGSEDVLVSLIDLIAYSYDGTVSAPSLMLLSFLKAPARSLPS